MFAYSSVCFDHIIFYFWSVLRKYKCCLKMQRKTHWVWTKSRYKHLQWSPHGSKDSKNIIPLFEVNEKTISHSHGCNLPNASCMHQSFKMSFPNFRTEFRFTTHSTWLIHFTAEQQQVSYLSNNFNQILKFVQFFVQWKLPISRQLNWVERYNFVQVSKFEKLRENGEDFPQLSYFHNLLQAYFT